MADEWKGECVYTRITSAWNSWIQRAAGASGKAWQMADPAVEGPAGILLPSTGPNRRANRVECSSSSACQSHNRNAPLHASPAFSRSHGTEAVILISMISSLMQSNRLFPFHSLTFPPDLNRCESVISWCDVTAPTLLSMSISGASC